MSRILYTVFMAVAPVLVLTAISIASVGYLWSMIKPTVEHAELKYLKDINSTNP